MHCACICLEKEIARLNASREQDGERERERKTTTRNSLFLDKTACTHANTPPICNNSRSSRTCILFVCSRKQKRRFQ